MQEIQELKCPICFDRYNETTHCPTSLNCDHTICLLCYKKSLELAKFKCPFCRSNIVSHGPTIKRNMALLSIVRKHLMFGECSKHENMPLRFLCQEDKKQVCEECLRNGDHKGHHEVKDVGPLRAELDKKAKIYQEKEEGWIQYEKKSSGLLEARKHEDMNAQSKILAELESLVKKRRLEVTSKIALTYEHQGNMLSSALGKKSKARLELRQKVKEYKEDALRLLDEDIDEMPLKFDREAAEQSMMEFSKLSDDVCSSLVTSLKEQSAKMSSIGFSQRELMVDAKTEENDSAFKIASNLRFTAQNDTMIIELCLEENRDCLLEVEAWEDMKHVEFWFKKLSFHRNDLTALEYVMGKLNKVQSVKIIQIDEAELSGEFNRLSRISKLLRILFSNHQDLRDIQLKLWRPEQGAIIDSLANEILPNLKTKVLNTFKLLFLTQCSGRGFIEALIESLSLFSETLEHVSLKSPGVMLDYNLLATRPLNLPKLKSFKLELDYGARTEDRERASNFMRSSLKSMKCLEELGLRLYNYSTEKQKISNLFVQFEGMTTLRDLSFIMDGFGYGNGLPEFVSQDNDSENFYLMVDTVSKSILKMDFLSSVCLGYRGRSETANGSQQIKDFIDECQRHAGESTRRDSDYINPFSLFFGQH